MNSKQTATAPVIDGALLAEQKRKNQYVKSAILRYSTMMVAFFASLFCASFIPLNILLGGSWVLFFSWFAVFGSYVWKAVGESNIPLSDPMSPHSVEGFWREWGFSEVAVGVFSALYLSRTLFVFDIIVPGSLIAGSVAAVSVVLASLSYVAISLLVDERKVLDRNNNFARGVSKSLLVILVGAFVVKAIGLLTGFYALAYATEFAVFAFFSSLVMANIYNALDKGYVELSGNPLRKEYNPSFGAIVLFANTIDLLITAVRFIFLLKSDNKGDNYGRIMQSLFNTAVLTLGVAVVWKMVTDTVNTERLYNNAAAPPYTPGAKLPSYQESTNTQSCN